MFFAFLALAMTSSVCPMTIGIGTDGSVFSGRFHGWYKVSLRTLDSDLRAGCYNDANPSRVTSVTLFLADAAPKPRVDSVLSVLKSEGWGREKITIESWRSYPKAP
jgi:hypothetical protein